MALWRYVARSSQLAQCEQKTKRKNSFSRALIVHFYYERFANRLSVVAIAVHFLIDKFEFCSRKIRKKYQIK